MKMKRLPTPSRITPMRWKAGPAGLALALLYAAPPPLQGRALWPFRIFRSSSLRHRPDVLTAPSSSG
jgi:hypothetical protein